MSVLANFLVFQAGWFATVLGAANGAPWLGPVAVLAAAIAGAAFGLVPAAISFASGVVAFMVLRVVPLRKLYEAIDWPVIVLLGSMIPVAVAMETTGLADQLANSLLEHVAQDRPVIALALILIVTMTLSDFMNNAATAAVTEPSTGQLLG